MNAKMFYLHVLENLHVGSGEGSGVIDMPIAREAATRLPVVPGSGLKGALKWEYGDSDLFGSKEKAGLIAPPEARLLLLPVASWAGTFAWITCPLVLRRWLTACKDLDRKVDATIPSTIADDQIMVQENSMLKISDQVHLDELSFEMPESDLDNTTKIAAQIAEDLFVGDTDWQTALTTRFAIVSDTVFSYFAEHGTEVRARIKVNDDTGVVERGALWYEESLPAETVLFGVVAADKARTGRKQDEDILSKLPDHRIQLGGNWSTGGGQVRWRMVGAKNGD